MSTNFCFSLDDGRQLLDPKRYDQLLKEHGEETLQRWGLVRVSERFRVIALGLPVSNRLIMKPVYLCSHRHHLIQEIH
jgi:hypothetical protein